MILTCKEYYSRELDKSVVERCDSLHIQVVCRLIEDQYICSHDHKLGEKTSNLLASGEDLNLLDSILTTEQHSSEESTYVCSILLLRELCKPVYDYKIVIELLSVILREVTLRCCNTPFVLALIWLFFASKYLEQHCCSLCLRTYKCYLIFSTNCKCYIVENFNAVNGLRKMLNC